MKLQWTHEQTITDMRRVAEILKKDGISRSEYQQFGKVGITRIKRLFGAWNAALVAAGLNIVKEYCYDRNALVDEVAAVYGNLGCVPTVKLWQEKSIVPISVLKKRFGGIRKACIAAKEKYRELPLVEPKNAMARGAQSAGEVFGPPFDLPPLRSEPLNEIGTQCAFVMMAQRLGFEILLFRSCFPDILAQRLLSDGNSQMVNIEVEFRSKSYLYHRHPIDEKILIVCWKHDWKDSPLEVIELSSLLQRHKNYQLECVGKS